METQPSAKIFASSIVEAMSSNAHYGYQIQKISAMSLSTSMETAAIVSKGITIHK